MDKKERIGFKTCMRLWLLSLTLSIAVFAIVRPAGLSSFQPQRNKTEAQLQVSTRSRCTIIVYGYKTSSPAPAQTGSAVFPTETPILCTSNELIKIKFQCQSKLYASLKTTLQWSSNGGTLHNSEQESLFG